MSTLFNALAARDKERKGTLSDDEREAAYESIDDALTDALDWIARALPWLEWIEGNANRDAYLDPSDLAELTALIAQAEGQKDGNK